MFSFVLTSHFYSHLHMLSSVFLFVHHQLCTGSWLGERYRQKRQGKLFSLLIIQVDYVYYKKTVKKHFKIPLCFKYAWFLFMRKCFMYDSFQIKTGFFVYRYKNLYHQFFIFSRLSCFQTSKITQPLNFITNIRKYFKHVGAGEIIIIFPYSMTALQRNSSNNMYEEAVQNKRIGYHHNASQHVSADPYSSFTLVDNLTLNSIKLHHKKPRKYKNFQPPLEDKMQKCLDLLTFTKKFQLSSVQQKNYKKIISKQENAKTISIKKNNSFKPFVARKKQGPITTLEKQELRRYLSGEIENVDPKIINNPSKNTKHSSLFSVHKLAQKKPTKLKSITNNTQNRNSQESSQKKITEKTGKYQKLEKYIDEEVFPSLSKQIKIALMENNEYLVVPKDMNKPRFNHKKSAYHEKKNEIKFSEKDYHISQLKFEKSKETPLIKNLKNKQTINDENEGKQPHTGRERIFDSIKKGEYFKVEIELSVDPSLLLCQDDKSNNLLHHCILQNKPQLFEMILKKSTQHKIDLITMKNKFRRSPYELGHLMDFFHKNDLNLMVESIYKHSKLKVAYELFSIIP